MEKPITENPDVRRLIRQVEWMRNALKIAAEQFEHESVDWQDAADACREAANYNP